MQMGLLNQQIQITNNLLNLLSAQNSNLIPYQENLNSNPHQGNLNPRPRNFHNGVGGPIVKKKRIRNRARTKRMNEKLKENGDFDNIITQVAVGGETNDPAVERTGPAVEHGIDRAFSCDYCTNSYSYVASEFIKSMIK